VITYDKLKQKPRAFRSITGMSITEFDRLFRKIIPVWTRSERERLSRPDRKRAIGGGHPYTLRLRERLLMTVVWLRLYLSTEALGFFFGWYTESCVKSRSQVSLVGLNHTGG
jgi:hypothetical protein